MKEWNWWPTTTNRGHRAHNITNNNNIIQIQITTAATGTATSPLVVLLLLVGHFGLLGTRSSGEVVAQMLVPVILGVLLLHALYVIIVLVLGFLHLLGPFRRRHQHQVAEVALVRVRLKIIRNSKPQSDRQFNASQISPRQPDTEFLRLTKR